MVGWEASMILQQAIIVILAASSVYAVEADWPPFKDGEGPCTSLYQVTPHPNKPGQIQRRVKTPVNTTPIRTIETTMPDGKFIMPVCEWTSDEWKHPAIGSIVLKFNDRTILSEMHVGQEVHVGTSFRAGGRGEKTNFVTLESVVKAKGAKQVRVHIIAQESGPMGIIGSGEVINEQSLLGVDSVRNDQPTAMPKQ